MARRTTIGLDIGSSAVRAAELSFGRSGVTLERLGQVLLPVGAVRDGEVLDVDAVATALKELWRAVRFSHKRVVVGVAGQRVVVREAELPDMPLADVRRALPFQVQDVLPMPVDQALMDFHPLERGRSPMGSPVLRGLLVAAWRDAVESTVAAVQRAGLDPVVVDLSSFAVLRSMGTGLDVEVGTEAVVDIGASVTNVVIHSGGTPRFVRILLRGGQDITEAIAERTGTSMAEAEEIKRAAGQDGELDPSVATVLAAATQQLVEEIRGSIGYYTAAHPSHPVERLVLSGGGAQLSGLAEQLQAATGLTAELGSAVHRVRPGRGAPDADALSSLAVVSAVPVGLALGASA